MRPKRARSLALGLMAEGSRAWLAEADGDQPRVRVVSPVRTEEFTVYLAGGLKAGQKVELCYLGKDYDQVRITGMWAPAGGGVCAVIPQRVRYKRLWAHTYEEVPL